MTFHSCFRSASSSSLLSTPRATSSATVTSTSLASTSTKLNAGIHASVNGSEGQPKDATDKSAKELASSPTTSGRVENIKIKSEPLSPSPEKSSPTTDRRSNGASPKPNTSKSRSTTGMIVCQPKRNRFLMMHSHFTDIKPNSPSRANQDLKDSKEKVKTKSILTDSMLKSNDSTANRSDHKTVTFSDRPSPSSKPIVDTKPISIERPKGRLLFNKDEKAKSLSPPLSAENEYDFDQHLLKEEYSTKKDFFEKIHLKPRIPSTDSPLVQLPKMPKTEQKSELPTNLPKDKDNNKPSPTTTNASVSSINRPSVSSSSSGSIDKQLVKKSENKTSKRKSREPVKNVAKVKCASPNDRTIDTKWDPVKSTIISSVSPSSPISTATTSNSSSNSSSTSTSNNSDRLRRLQEAPAIAARILGAISQQNKNHLKSIQATSSTTKSNQTSSSTSTPSNASTKSVFKTPSSSKESPSQSTGAYQIIESTHSIPNQHLNDRFLLTGLKAAQAQTPTSESTSIIINNVQRPNQADTPRPSMSFKPNLGQQQSFFFSPNLNRNFPNETEIQEIRNDDPSKSIVYGPAMSLAKPFESAIPTLPASVGQVGADLLPQLINRYKPTQLNFPLNAIPFQINQYMALQQLQSFPSFFDGLKQNNKPKKPAIDAKKPSGSSNLELKANSLQKNFHQAETAKQQNVQSLFPCRIPPSLSITLTNDESESANRSIFNTKNSNVVNSIEIVKLTDELNNEPNARFPSPLPSSSTSSKVDKLWLASKTQQANKIDSTSPTSKECQADFQMKFVQSISDNANVDSMNVDSMKALKKSKPPQQQKQQIRPNLNVSIEEIARNQEATKRKLHLDDKSASKVRKLQPSSAQSKSSPVTQRPVPDLLIPKDDKKVSVSNSSPAQSTSGASAAVPNNKKSTDRQSPTVSSNVSSSDKSTSLMLAVAQAKVQQVDIPTSKYLPLQTSPMPIWTNHCTADQMANHKTLMKNLENKTNSGTFVD